MKNFKTRTATLKTDLKGGSVWLPGSYTAARCDLWRKLTEEGKTRLTMWIMNEAKTGKPFKTELPNIGEEFYVEK